MSEELLYEVRGFIGFITLNRESKRNALSQGMIAALMDRLENADKDDAVRALCVTGAGDKAFCSGADLAATLAGGGEGSPRLAGPLPGAGEMRKELRKRY